MISRGMFGIGAAIGFGISGTCFTSKDRLSTRGVGGVGLSGTGRAVA